MKRTASMADVVKPLSECPSQAYLSNAVQVADLLEWILEQVGTAKVWQTSFSISEEFLRRLFFIEKSGKVDTIHLILDFKATQKTLRLWPFLTRVIEHTYLADNHSKVILIRSEETARTVSIITSQNLTRGNRNESAIVTTDAAIFATFHASLTDIMKNHSVPLSELFAQKIAE